MTKTKEEVEKGLFRCADGFFCQECPYQHLENKDYPLKCIYTMIKDVAEFYKEIVNGQNT